MQDLQILYVPDAHRLEITLTSALDVPAVKAIAEQANQAIETYQCKSLLLDLSQTMSIITTAQNFDLLHDFESFSWSPDRDWAILYAHDAHIYTLAAKFIAQRGSDHIQFFDRKTAAIAWLKSRA